MTTGPEPSKRKLADYIGRCDQCGRWTFLALEDGGHRCLSCRSAVQTERRVAEALDLERGPEP